MSTSSSTTPPSDTTTALPTSPALAITATPASFRPIFLTLLITTPLLALLPPRKLDMYTFSLGAAFVLSAEELTYGRASSRFARPLPQHAPPQPDTQEETFPVPSSQTTPHSDKQDTSGGGVQALARRLWFGAETPQSWKQQRAREEREALEDGRGYGDLIGDSVREVFGTVESREEVEAFDKKRRRERDGKDV
ncbi:MAG: hypothetical protein Q9220_000743 [cf. Caloplaca sp. 1 TL-2023]